MLAGLANTAVVSLLEGEEAMERSRLRFLTRPKLRKMSRSREIESEIRFRWREVAVKSWDNSI